MPDTGDKLVASISCDPLIFLEADANADGVFVYHHDIKKSLSGPFTLNASQATGTARWYYDSNLGVTTGDIDLVDNGGTYTDGIGVDSADIVMGFYIKNKGINSLGETTTDEVVIFHGASGPGAGDHAIGPGEVFVAKYNSVYGTTVLNAELESTGAGHTVMCEILVLVDDVSAT